MTYEIKIAYAIFFEDKVIVLKNNKKIINIIYHYSK